jgi:hypothetical protein
LIAFLVPSQYDAQRFRRFGVEAAVIALSLGLTLFVLYQEKELG